MAQARIYWEMDDYQQVEKVFRKSVEFCSEHDVWKLNVAHVLFMQASKSQKSQVLEPGLAQHEYIMLQIRGGCLRSWHIVRTVEPV